MPESKTGPAYRVVTPRLVIRCWNPEDAPLLKEAIDASLEHLRPWMTWAHEEPQELQQKIEKLRVRRARFDLGESFSYGIFDREETRVLGSVSLMPRVGPDALEIGYWIHADFINQGLVTEASAALTKVAFEVHHVQRVDIYCDPRNVRSAAVPRKLGYTHEATLRRRYPFLEGRIDSMIWNLFAEDYPTTPSSQAVVEAYDVIGRRIL